MINWHDRYAKLLQRERGLFDARRSVLEVGSGPWGIALWLQRPVVGLERDWSQALPNPLIQPVEGDVLRLPFADDSYDYVICVDVLEHLAEGDRATALCELIRVARDKVLVSCPCGAAAEEGERAFAGLFDALGLPRPGWLTEHFDNGLPRLGPIVQTLIDSGYAFEVAGNENRLQHYAGLLLDTALPVASGWNVEHATKTVLEPPVGAAAWDEYYSYLFTVDKRRRRHERADEDISPLPASDERATWALYAVVHDVSLMDDIAPIRYVCSGAATTGEIPPVEPPPLVDNGHLPNWRWSELSAMYSVWKDGPATDVVGFCHYRRFFDFRPDAGDERETTITRSAISRVKPGSSFEEVVRRVASGTIIVARSVDLGASVFDHYSRYHNADDYLQLLSIVSESHPELLPFFVQDLVSTELYCNNMFLMPWQLFDRLCSTWFPVLEEFCARADASRAQDYQNRDVSFLSERLFDTWVKYVGAHGVEVEERPIFFVEGERSAAPSVAAMLAIAGQQPPPPVGEPLRVARAMLDAERARGDDLETETARKDARLAVTSAELAAERAALAVTSAELAAERAALAVTSAELAAERAAVAKVAASASWRLTAPLRSAKRVAQEAARAARRRGSQ
jgi:Domain of unknown function (DUF4422)/Methyltransferase domain